MPLLVRMEGAWASRHEAARADLAYIENERLPVAIFQRPALNALRREAALPAIAFPE